MEGLIFLVLAGAVLVFMIRRTKRKAREVEPASSLQRLQEENRQAAKSALGSDDWKRKARKAKARAQARPSSEPTPEPEPVPEPTPEPVPKPTPEPQAASASGNLLFEYEDSRGNVSTREISSWTVNGNKLRGYCLDREAVRTFRLDRVTRVIQGEALLDASRHMPARPTTAPPEAKRKGAPEILFTGFDAPLRKTLEATAESHGFRVRKSVTKNLDVLVRGPRPSQSKLADAKDKPGCSVVDKEGFLWMVTTGEITS